MKIFSKISYIFITIVYDYAGHTFGPEPPDIKVMFFAI